MLLSSVAYDLIFLVNNDLVRTKYVPSAESASVLALIRGFFTIPWGKTYARSPEIFCIGKRHSLFNSCSNQTNMWTNWMALLKNLVKTSLDQYILPGTLTGTEILLLYAGEWRRHLANVMLAFFFWRSSTMARPTLESVNPETADHP